MAEDTGCFTGAIVDNLPSGAHFNNDVAGMGEGCVAFQCGGIVAGTRGGDVVDCYHIADAGHASEEVGHFAAKCLEVKSTVLYELAIEEEITVVVAEDPVTVTVHGHELDFHEREGAFNGIQAGGCVEPFVVGDGAVVGGKSDEYYSPFTGGLLHGSQKPGQVTVEAKVAVGDS